MSKGLTDGVTDVANRFDVIYREIRCTIVGVLTLTLVSVFVEWNEGMKRVVSCHLADMNSKRCKDGTRGAGSWHAAIELRFLCCGRRSR